MSSAGKIILALIAIVVLLASTAAAILLVLMLRGGGASTTPSPFAPGEATAQIAALQAKLGHPLQAVSVALDRRGMTVELQNPALPQVTDQWSIGHIVALGGVIDWIRVSGPEAVQSGAAGLSVKDRAFDLAAVKFDAVPAIVQAAIERAALQETAKVTRMVLAKSHILIPTEQAGPLRWDISINSAHESAEAYFDPSGTLTRIDLSGTLRAKSYDLSQGGAPLLEAVKAIATHFDGKERLDHLMVYADGIHFHLVSAGPGETPGAFVSGINGLARDGYADLVSFPPILGPDQKPRDQPMTTGEIDWAALPRFVQTARTLLAMPGAKVTSLEIRKSAHGLDPAALEWEIGLQPKSGSSGSVILDSAGKPLRLHREDGKLAALDMQSPAAIAQFLETLRAKLDPHTPVMALTFTPTTARIELRDPHKPDRLVTLGYDGYKLDILPLSDDRPGRWMGMPYADDWLFDLASLDAPFLANLPARESAALALLNIPGGKVSDITIGRNRMMFETNRQLVVQIDVEGESHADGRVFFDPRGQVMRKDGP